MLIHISNACLHMQCFFPCTHSAPWSLDPHALAITAETIMVVCRATEPER